MSGLDIAAGAASVIALCNLVVSKLVPFLRDCAHADETAQRLHREICDFREVLVVVEADLGARTGFPLQRSFDKARSRAMKKHVEECKRTIGEIERELPEPQSGNKNFIQQMRTHRRMAFDSQTLSKLRQDIPALKATLQLWLQVVQMDGLRSSREAQEEGQQVVEAGIADLSLKMDNLRDVLEKRDRDSDHSVFRLGGEDSIKRSGKECLDSAGSIREAYATSYKPTAASVAARHFDPADIAGWNKEVMRQAPTDPSRWRNLDVTAPSVVNESQSSSHGDSGYDTDQISKFRSLSHCKDGFSATFLTDLINRSLSDAQKHCEANQYDRAAEAQAKAINWGVERERNHGIEFKDKRSMLQTLAKIQLERRIYGHAEEILFNLREDAEPDSPDAWALDHELADAYLAHGKYESAARYANRANNGRQSSLAIGDNKIIETLILLSAIYDKMGNLTEADAFRLEVLKHRILRQGPSDEIMFEVLGQESAEDEVHKIIDDLDDNGDQDILALKTFQWVVALNRPALVFSLWGRYEIIAANVDAQNESGMTPLMSSAVFGHEGMVQFLLEKGADVNARASDDYCNDTALMLAAEKQFPSIVKQLLAKGANVKDCNKHGLNALHRAQGRPLDSEDAVRKEIVTVILEKDRERLINTQCIAGKTPLHLASENGNTPIMDFLLSLGADIEARDSGKRTPLVLAIDSGWPKAVELLLDLGADPDVEDARGRTPHKIARRGVGGSREIQTLLDKAKKNPRVRQKSSAMMTSPHSPQHRNLSSVSLSRTSTQHSSAAILSPTATLPSAFSIPHSDGQNGMMPSMFRLSLRAPSVVSTTSASTVVGRRAWSIYSKLEKVGRDPP